MVLIMGLYDRFIAAVSDLTRFRVTKSNLLFLGVLAGALGVTIVSLAGPLLFLMTRQPAVMYALFIGMTLGGTPLLVRMMRPIRWPSLLATVLGVALMLGIASLRSQAQQLSEEEKGAVKEAVAHGEYELRPAYGLDVAAGVLGMSAMVLPGISGAYMLLLLGRYEQILAAISLAKSFAISAGQSGGAEALRVLIPVAIGALLSLVGVTNLLRWLLRHHQKPTTGFLLGIVLGSVVMLWQVLDPQGQADYAKVGAALVAGFLLTIGLSRVGAKADSQAD
jgi:putative membrane protein